MGYLHPIIFLPRFWLQNVSQSLNSVLISGPDFGPFLVLIYKYDLRVSCPLNYENFAIYGYKCLISGPDFNS